MYEPAFYLPYVLFAILCVAALCIGALCIRLLVRRRWRSSIRGTDTPGCRHDRVRLLRLLRATMTWGVSDVVSAVRPKVERMNSELEGN